MCLKDLNGIAFVLAAPLVLLLINGILLSFDILGNIRNRLLRLNYSLFLALPVQEHELIHRDGGVRERYFYLFFRRGEGKGRSRVRGAVVSVILTEIIIISILEIEDFIIISVFGLFYNCNGFFITGLDLSLSFFCPLGISLCFSSLIESLFWNHYSLYNCFSNWINILTYGRGSIKDG